MLKKNLSVGYKSEIKSSEIVEYRSVDESYIDLICNFSDGGYFYNGALHLYGYDSSLPGFHNIYSVNQSLIIQYNEVFGNVFSFGEDIFGNQFAFSDNGIFHFNIETGEKEKLCDKFSDWLDLLNDDLDFLTGLKFTYLLDESLGNRLCPKIPFVVGGEYADSNLYNSLFPDYLNINANIAKQISHLPNGTKIKLDIR